MKRGLLGASWRSFICSVELLGNCKRCSTNWRFYKNCLNWNIIQYCKQHNDGPILTSWNDIIELQTRLHVDYCLAFITAKAWLRPWLGSWNINIFVLFTFIVAFGPERSQTESVLDSPPTISVFPSGKSLHDRM